MDNWQNKTKIRGMLQHNYENQRNKVMFLYNCKKKAENLNICLFCEYFRPQGCIKHSRNKGLMESEFEGLFYLYSSSVSSHPDLIWGWTCSEYALIALLRATCLVSSGFERFPCSGGGIEPDSSWERASHKLRPTSPFDALSCGFWQERRANFTLVWCG